MIVATETYVVARCPVCGKFEAHPLSLFAFSGSHTVQINCSCGNTKLSLGTRNKHQFWVQLPCVLCENKHLYYYRGKDLWSDRITTLVCSDTGYELCHIGPKDQIEDLIESMEDDLEAVMMELGYDDYFHNPEIMMEVLNCLHDVAEEGYIYCECGNCQIEVDVLPDRLELTCKECGSTVTIYAETKQDLEFIRKLDVIELVREGANKYDGLSNRTRGRKNRKKSKQ